MNFRRPALVRPNILAARRSRSVSLDKRRRPGTQCDRKASDLMERMAGRFKLPFVYKYFPNFCTSPSILRGYFARQSASFMDDSLDPEKQFHGGWNPALEEYANNFKAYIYSPEETPVIVGIGRVWREERGITKTITNAVSTWDTVKT